MSAQHVNASLVLLLLSLPACVSELGELGDPDDEATTSSARDLTQLQPLPGDAAVQALNVYASGTITLNGGVGGRSEDHTVSTDCPGYRRETFEATGDGSCSVVRWVTSSPTDCRIVVHVGAGVFRRTTCSWKVYASQVSLMSYVASDTNNATQNTTNLLIPILQPGDTFEAGTCSIPGATASGDTYLRLLGPGGAVVAANDDSCGLASRLLFTVPPAGIGSYVLQAGCFSSGSCSGTVGWLIK